MCACKLSLCACNVYIVRFCADRTAVILAPQAFISPAAYVDQIFNATTMQDWLDYLEGRLSQSQYIKVIQFSYCEASAALDFRQKYIVTAGA